MDPCRHYLSESQVVGAGLPCCEASLLMNIDVDSARKSDTGTPLGLRVDEGVSHTWGCNVWFSVQVTASLSKCESSLERSIDVDSARERVIPARPLG